MSLAVLYRSDARFDQCLLADPFQFLGDCIVDLTRWTRLGGVDLLHDLQVRITSEWSATCQQLVEDYAQAEDVRTPINPVTFAPGLFWAHVGGRPGVPRTLAEVLVFEGKTEIGKTRFT